MEDRRELQEDDSLLGFLEGREGGREKERGGEGGGREEERGGEKQAED